MILNYLRQDWRTKLLKFACLLLIVELLTLVIKKQEVYIQTQVDPIVKQFVVKYGNNIPLGMEPPYGFWLAYYEATWGLTYGMAK